MRMAKMARGGGVWVWLILLGLTLGCASSGRTGAAGAIEREVTHVDSPEWVQANTSAKVDDYSQSVALRGPDVEAWVDKDGSYYRAHIRGKTAKNGARQFQIYVAASLKGQWHNLHRARDQEAIPFSVAKVSRKKRCVEEDCSYYEHVAVPLPVEYLPVRKRVDIDLYLEGPGGDIVVTIPATYVQGFLARVEAEEHAMAAAGRPATRNARMSYCESKYVHDSKAMGFCRQEARASYTRLKPAIDAAKADAFTRTAKVLDTCMRRHNGKLGIDWMMVEHCYGKAVAGPASR